MKDVEHLQPHQSVPGGGQIAAGMKILLAVDGSTYSEAAVNEVAARPWPEGSKVRVISVIELPITPTEETHSLFESYCSLLERAGQEQARSAIDCAVERLRARAGEPLEITTEAVIGRAKEAIMNEAERWRADLIVLGSQGYGWGKRFRFGSVALAVATSATCSVEIVRSHAEPAQRLTDQHFRNE